MADQYDIDYRKIDGGSLLRTGGGINGGVGTGGGGFGFSGSGSATFPGMPDMTEFYRAMAERQAEKENYQRQQRAEEIARQNDKEQYSRKLNEVQMRQHQHDQLLQQEQARQMSHPEEPLEGMAPVVENRMGAQGQRYDYVDPRAAAMANAKAQKAGYGGNAFIGGRIGSNLASSFSHDDLSAPLEWMGGAVKTDKDEGDNPAQDEIERRSRAAKYGYGG